MRLPGKVFLVTLAIVSGVFALSLAIAAAVFHPSSTAEGRASLWFLLGSLAVGGGLASLVLRGVVGRSVRGVILDLEKSREELLAAVQTAEDANRAKSEFVASISHEIRTPMTAILGFVDLMVANLSCCTCCPESVSCQTREKNLEYAQTIERNGKFLLQIVNDVLDLSKIEAGRCEIERIGCNVGELLDDVEALMEGRCQAKGLAFGIECVGAIPETVETDPVRLRQILINLLGNAVKFTECGEVRLVVRFPADTVADRRGAGQGLLEFDVIDTGMGILPEQMPRLFQPFSQADNATTRKFGGTGLGLAISKHLAMMLGGDLTVTSAPGQGSTFRVTIATGRLEGVRLANLPERGRSPCQALATETVIPSLAGTRVLLAEDGPDNRRLIACLLAKADVEVTMVENGQQAVNAAIAAEHEGTPFDVVLMDMQMPLVDGYEAVGMLRMQGYSRPIIALTAHAMAGDRQKCLNAGCNEYVAKPIDKVRLVQTIERWLPSRRAEASPS
jgi:signal transduction histidine kinase/CheY-like chemotaxis protein